MDIFSSIILGVVQGLTEFLPISSSGHLILARDILGLQVPSGLAVDAVLQFATSLAVLVYFRTTLWGLLLALGRLLRGRPASSEERILLFALGLGTVPALIAGIFLESAMETLFRSPTLVAVALLLGSFIMWAAEAYAKGKGSEPLTLAKGLIIGVFQALALVPGMSRSGMSISGGLYMGLTREASARFAFLLALPILVGSGLKKLFELGGNGYLETFGVSLFASSLAAFLVGMAVIHFLLKYLRTHTLSVFIWYRVALAVVILATPFL